MLLHHTKAFIALLDGKKQCALVSLSLSVVVFLISNKRLVEETKDTPSYLWCHVITYLSVRCSCVTFLVRLCSLFHKLDVYLQEVM